MQVAQKRGLQDGACVFGLKKSGSLYASNQGLIIEKDSTYAYENKRSNSQREDIS
jgi:hypothetical protein